MEASTVPLREASTGSRTIADLLPLAAEKHADAVAIRHKVDDEWRDVTFAEVGEIVPEIGLGLIDLGIEPGRARLHPRQHAARVDLRRLRDHGAGAVVVPIYPTNSPEECEWVVGNSGAVAVVCEDAEQLAKITQVQRAASRRCAIIVAIDAAGDVGDAVSLDDLRERGRARDASELEARYAAVKPEDPFTVHLHVGHDRPAQGLRPHPRQLPRGPRHGRGARPVRVRRRPDLPLPAAGPRLRAADPARRRSTVGATIAYFGGDTKQIIPELMEVKPTYLPSVPRIFEKLYTLARRAS